MFLLILITLIIGFIIYLIAKISASNSDPNLHDGVVKYNTSKGGVRGNDGSDILIYNTDDKIIKFYMNDTSTQYSFSDILQCEIIEDGRTTVKKSTSGTIGRALLGGLLAGGVGAIIGGATSSSKVQEKINRISIRIIVNDPNHPSWEIFYLNSIFGEQKGSYLYNGAMISARNVHAILSGFIQIGEQMREVQNQVVAQQVIQQYSIAESTIQQMSVADELIKLKSLLDSAIITQEEFDSQKKKILNQ